MITQHDNEIQSATESVQTRPRPTTSMQNEDLEVGIDGSPESVTEELSIDSSEKSASIQKYEDEWTQLYRRDDPELGELRRRAVLGNLRASRFRSVCWRCLLGVLSPDNSEWLSQLRQNRKHYNQLLQNLLMEPWDRKPENSPQSLVENNPLSQNAESIWHQYFCDRDLKAVIRQDVIRTFPGVDFFREDKIQHAMVNILFCYARQNPAMCYRQGMHEILAPLLFVLHCDHQALLHTREQVQVNQVIAEVLDPDYLEADGYSLFSKIIGGIESCYRINNLTPDATGYFPSTLRSPNERTEIEVVAQLNEIKDNLLLPNDRQLHQHLENLDIPLPLFGIRWLRVLFGREFPLQDLLVLWDAIFAEGNNFELVNYVVAAMLIAIREQLLNGDYTMCLTYLMRYPGAVDITCIIEHALYLKDPQKYCCPPMTSFPNVVSSAVGNRAETRTLNSSRSDKKTETQSGTLNRLKKLSTKSSRWTGARPTPRTAGRSDVDAAIVDGYTLDDPAVLRAELQHAHQVMALCQLKLAQYHDVLQRSVYPSDVVEAQQALDGIHELCSLLGSRHRPSNSQSSEEVEAAYEAGETRQRLVSPPSRLTLTHNHSVQVPHTPAIRRPPSEVALKLFSKTEGLSGHSVAGAPLQDPTLDRAQQASGDN